MSRFAGDPDVMVARAPQHIPHTPYASLNAWVRSDVMVAHAPQHIPHSRNVPRSGHVLCNAAVFACPFVRAVSAIPVACIARMPGSDAVISSVALAVIEPCEPSRRVAVLLSAPHHPAVAPVSPSRRLAVRTPPSRRRPCVAESPSCCPHPPPRPNPAVAPVSPPLLRARPLSPHGVCLAARGRRPWTRCAASWTRSSPSPASLRPAPTPSPVSRPPCTGKAQSLHGVHLEKRGPSQSGCGPPPADCAPAATQPPLAAAAGVSLW